MHPPAQVRLDAREVPIAGPSSYAPSTEVTAEVAPDEAVAPPVDFAAFYESEAERVHRAVSATLFDPATAREAVDEAMARAYARWDQVGRYDAPGGWVYRTAVNWSISRWRKVRRERPLPSDGSLDGPSSLGAIAGDGSPALAALRRLPIEQRSVVVCRILLDLDTRATAVALDIREGTVKSRLARALAALRHELEDRS